MWQVLTITGRDIYNQKIQVILGVSELTQDHHESIEAKRLKLLEHKKDQGPSC